MNVNQYMELFVEESREQLQRLNHHLIKLESNPNNTEEVNEIFRVAHTLKGMAGTMGYKAITTLTHFMENTLDLLKTQKLYLDSKLTDTLFECLDALEMLLESVINYGTDSDVDIKQLISKLESFKANELLGEKNAAVLIHSALSLDQFHKNIIERGIERGFKPYYIEVHLNKGCLLKSARAYVVFKVVEGVGDIIRSIPTVQDIEQEKFEFIFSLVIISRLEDEVISAKLRNITEIDDIVVRQITSADMVQVSDDKIQTENIEHNKPSTAEQTKFSGFGQRTGKNIKVDTERLDQLMNLVSELIIIKNRIQGIVKSYMMEALSESLEYLGKTTTDIHDAVMQVRMVQIDTVFNRFPRVVRDLAKSTGKEINLNIFGAGTELDRTIADEIGEPLIHLIRNAVDHGIESTDERIVAGKTKIGNIDLEAYHDGNDVIIAVGDDGKGIDQGKVLKQAVAKGLINEGEISNLSEREVLNYLFDPRISTAKTVSSISGRGVGMDAVKTKVESLGGVIDIETSNGKGTRFIIRLPLTLSIIQALVIRVSREQFAVPLSSVKEILNVNPGAVKQLRNQEVLNYRDVFIPLVRLNKRLGIANQSEQLNNSGSITMVIIKKEDKLSAISVDELVGQQEIVIKSLGKYLSNIKVVSGATILGDGRVITILDTNHLV